MPKTRLGKWSARLIVTFLLLFVIFQLLVASGQREGETFSDNLTLSIPALLMGVAGIAAFFTGSVSLIKFKERSVLVFISTAVGLFILAFILGEILFPH